MDSECGCNHKSHDGRCGNTISVDERVCSFCEANHFPPWNGVISSEDISSGNI